MSSLRKIVLVAEDEALIRMVAADFLAAAGYDVVEADNAAGALAILTAAASDIGALFTDYHMPGPTPMTGLELAHYAHGHWPWIALLVASGHPDVCADDLPRGGRFLSKPYNIEHVVEHLTDLMSPP